MNTDIKSVAIFTTTDKGNTGKTAGCKVICNWMAKLGVTWRAIDFDSANKGLFRAFPKDTQLISLDTAEKDGEFIKALRRIQPDHDVTVVDLQAHATKILVETMIKIDFIRSAYARRIQVVCVLFPSGDPQVLSRLNQDVRALTNAGPVKFVAIENARNAPGGNVRTGFAAWRGSSAGKYVAEHGVTIQMPSLLSAAEAAINNAHQEAHREVTFNELIDPGNKHLPAEYLGVIEDDFLRPIWAQLNRHADFFLPPTLAEEILAQLPPEAEEKPEDIADIFNCIDPTSFEG